MTSESERKAHALSLHLFSILDKHVDEASIPDEIAAEVLGLLKSLSLEDHLEVMRRENQQPAIWVSAKLEFGDNIMLELYARCEFFPCPEGECKYARSNFCKWCGKLKV